MNEIIVELLKVVILPTCVYFIMQFLRKRYAAFGDNVISEMEKLLTRSIAEQERFPELAPLNDQLSAALVEVKSIWNGSEFKMWNELMDSVKVFYGVYSEITKMKNSITLIVRDGQEG